jgi:Ca2+-binding EF-hand superfamily protein
MGSKTSKGKKDPIILSDEDLKLLKANTQYSEEEIQAWHSGFLKDCPSGKLDKKQFLSVYRVCIKLTLNI